jgi:hypothetical protein
MASKRCRSSSPGILKVDEALAHMSLKRAHASEPFSPAEISPLLRVFHIPELSMSLAHAAGPVAAAALAVATTTLHDCVQETLAQLSKLLAPNMNLLLFEAGWRDECLHACTGYPSEHWKHYKLDVSVHNPESRHCWGSATAFFAGKLYVLGGSCLFSGLKTDVSTFDISSNRWSRCTPMPTARRFLVATAAHGQVYAFGGYGEELGKPYRSFEAYDISADAWQSHPAMPTARSFWGQGAAALTDLIYVLGGSCLATQRTFECYDLGRKCWEELPPLPTGRMGFAVSIVAGRVFAVGGWLPPDEPVAIVEAFDPRLRMWQQLAPMPTARLKSAAAGSLGRLYVFGGIGCEDNTAFAAECYDTRRDTWESMPALPSSIKEGLANIDFVY